MSKSKITADMKELIIDALRMHGTLQHAARVTGVTIKELKAEMRRSDVFRRHVNEAQAEGKTNIADHAVEMIKLYASGTLAKTDRNVLTANIALANAYEAGFRGTTNVQGKIEHDVRVITAVPRPDYAKLPAPKVKVLKQGKPSVEDAIEGGAVETTSTSPEQAND